MKEIFVTRYLEPEFTDSTFTFHPDCRYFTGDVPCKLRRPCTHCDHYSPAGPRILIILLRRLGDVLLVSPLTRRLKREMPNAHITWLVQSDCARLVELNPLVDRVLIFDWQACIQLLSESYDLVLGFERIFAAAALVAQIQSRRKFGLAYGSANNTLYPLDEAAQYFFKMNTWNDFRTHKNTKTWTELYFEVAGYEYAQEDNVLELPEEVIEQAQTFLQQTGQGDIVCFNLGGSLATKLWPAAHWSALGKLLLEHGYRLLLLGGPAEAELYQTIVLQLEEEDPQSLLLPGTNCSIDLFLAYISQSHFVVTGDTFGFHASLTFNKPTAVLFGPSTPAEVVPKHKRNVVVLRSSFPCSPCARHIFCGGVGGCMSTISVGDVFAAVESLSEAIVDMDGGKKNERIF